MVSRLDQFGANPELIEAFIKEGGVRVPICWKPCARGGGRGPAGSIA